MDRSSTNDLASRKGGHWASPWQQELLQLPIASLRIRLRFKTRAHLPPFKGSTFRGALGISLRRLVCDQGMHSECLSCHRMRDCSYAWLFESILFRPIPGFQLDHAPPPMRLLIPDHQTTDFVPGDGLDMRLQIYGHAIAYVGLLLKAIDEAGSRRGVGSGLEAGQGRFQRLHIIDELSEEVIEEGMRLPKKVSANRLADLCPGGLSGPLRRLILSSPLQMKFGGALWQNPRNAPRLEVLLSAVTRRLYLLGMHAIFDAKLPEPEKLPPIGRLMESNVRWLERERFSNRSHSRKPISGMSGWLMYHVEHGEADSLLQAATWLGLGKQTVMGLGDVQLATS